MTTRLCYFVKHTISHIKLIVRWVVGKSILSYPTLKQIAATHNVSSAQVAFRWIMQNGVAAVTATNNTEYMHEDLSLSGFMLSTTEMQMLANISGTPPL
eukprot:m.34279 g.34279  ORF g.34279 m.34279 type:complete len:99 (-) comp8697_c0_seq2:73-369(-)